MMVILCVLHATSARVPCYLGEMRVRCTREGPPRDHGDLALGGLGGTPDVPEKAFAVAGLQGWYHSSSLSLSAFMATAAGVAAWGCGVRD